MTREIKFRAWDEGEKYMWHNVQDAYDTLGKHCEHSEETDCDCKETHYPSSMGSFGDVLENNDMKVMQFTGLRDKDGKEIYEGDILATSNYGGDKEDSWDANEWGYAVVSFIDTATGITIKVPGESVAWSWDDPDTVYSLKYCEVIGNIYENPELI